jgi:hypothetical protein
LSPLFSTLITLKSASSLYRDGSRASHTSHHSRRQAMPPPPEGRAAPARPLGTSGRAICKRGANSRTVAPGAGAPCESSVACAQLTSVTRARRQPAVRFRDSGAASPTSKRLDHKGMAEGNDCLHR